MGRICGDNHGTSQVNKFLEGILICECSKHVSEGIVRLGQRNKRKETQRIQNFGRDDWPLALAR